MPETDLELLIRAARGAGEIATRYTGSTAKRWDKPGGAGPVTEADLAVNDYLGDLLRVERPNYGWLSEETDDDPARQGVDTLFIVDPIDGTRSFVEGSNTWAHSIAIARNGQVTAGVVYLPLRDKLYAAERGRGAFLNDAPIGASKTEQVQASTILSAKPNLEARHWTAGEPPTFKRAYRPSLAYRLALVAEGRFDGMITFRPTWEWDIAAGSLIAEEAGALSTDRQGSMLQFNNPDPRLNGIITASPSVHRGLVAAHQQKA